MKSQLHGLSILFVYYINILRLQNRYLQLNKLNFQNAFSWNKLCFDSYFSVVFFLFFFTKVQMTSIGISNGWLWIENKPLPEPLLAYFTQAFMHHKATVKSLTEATPNPKTYMFLISACSCLCTIYWSQVLSGKWRCSWSSPNRRCSNYIWVINNSIDY